MKVKASIGDYNIICEEVDLARISKPFRSHMEQGLDLPEKRGVKLVYIMSPDIDLKVMRWMRECGRISIHREKNSLVRSRL